MLIVSVQRKACKAFFDRAGKTDPEIVQKEKNQSHKQKLFKGGHFMGSISQL
jgi:hypothetical protein